MSGTNRAVLARCPTEIESRTGLGVAVLIPTVLAFLGAMVALTNLGARPVAVVAGALVVAGIVFGVDRLMITSPLTVANVIMRAVMTLAMAWLIGEQLLVAAFASEVEAELLTVQAERTDIEIERITDDTDAELARIDYRLAALDSNPQLDSAQAALTEADAEVSDATAKLEELQVQLGAAIAGTTGAGGSGRAGDGPAADSIRADIDMARINLDEAINTRNRVATLLDTTTADTRAANDTETAALRQRRLEIEADRAHRIEQATNTIEGAAGIIARIEALERLAQTPFMAAQIWALRLLLLAIDTLPLIIKLTGARHPHPYDRLPTPTRA